MKKLLFLAIFATAVGFTSGNAANQPGVDCEQVLIDVYYAEISAGNASGAAEAASLAYGHCWLTGGDTDEADTANL